MKRKKILLIFIASVFLIGCNKEKSNQEIKINENDLSDLKENKSDDGKDEYSKVSSSESTSLKRISANEVKQHIGDSLSVTGFVADVYLSDKVAYLNMENKFPKNIFSCAVFSAKFEEFGDLSKFKGKNIEVSGRISTYKNKPQIILNSKDQIKIIK